MTRLKAFCVWFIPIAVIVAMFLLLGDVLTPFVAGLMLAYLLNPVVQKLVRMGISRRSACLLLIIEFLLVAAIALVILVPMLGDELQLLLASLPTALQWVRDLIGEYVPAAAVSIDQFTRKGLPGLVQNNMGSAVAVTANVVGGVVTGGQVAVSVIAFIALMPIVAFFMMKEWPHIVSSIDELLPRRQAPTVRRLVKQMDTRIAGFVRGQVLICFCLGTFYAIALSITGLKYAALVGAMAGVLSLIPFVGTLFAFSASIVIGLTQVPEVGFTVLIASVAVVAFGQFVEGNFITPRIVGDRVGLHPLWIMFALLAGAKLMGLLGMLLAVPVAAIIAVLVCYAREQYLQSTYYKGTAS